MNAYTKSAIRQTSENYIVTKRLFDAGLGPNPLWFCFAKKVHHEYIDNAGAVGFIVEDANHYPTKSPAKEKEIIAAGVNPDRIKSCIKKQLNGYVVDLNSVILIEVKAYEKSYSKKDIKKYKVINFRC